MRALLSLVMLALGSFRSPAQTPSNAPPVPAPPATQPHAQDTAQLSQEIATRRAAGDKYLPDAVNFTFGSRAIAANTIVDGPIAVAHGDLDVYGTVNGDVIAVDGNIHVHNGARVVGDAWAAAGSVIIDGGLVEGRKRAISMSAPVLPASRPHEPLTTLQSIKLVLSCFALLTIIGLGVMVFAEGNLDGVVIALERGFARSFWLGLGGQVIVVPALVALVVGLAITVIGVLLIPFAIVAYVIAVAGLVTLGFLAIARLTGGALASARGTTSVRGVHLRALIIGLIAYLGLWMLAAAFAWNPFAGAILRALAMAVTWVAATVGLGATLSSRAGTQRAVSRSNGRASTDELAWQTPTPVAGVAAATRRVVSVK
jgi:hypothetical protein